MIAESIVAEAIDHAGRDAPREACGLVIAERNRPIYVPCRNIAEFSDEFIMSPEDYAAAEDRGEVLAIVHSHVGVPPEPSHADLVGCERSGLPWLIVNWPVGSHRVIKPSGYVAPLKGRQFCHGVLDCYAIVRDYYKQMLNIDLLDHHRDEHWWDKGQNLYLENYERTGFSRVSGVPQKHDVLLMQVRSDVVNHAAIYLGDGRIIQHLEGRLSGEDIYGGYWQKHTTHVLRHRGFL